MLDNNKCILVYGANSQEIDALKDIGIKIVQITPEMTQMTLEDILEGLKFKTFNPKATKEKIAILNNFSDVEIRKSLNTIKATLKDVILAVPTPVSVKWTFNDLAEHLVEERNLHLNSQKGR